MTVVCFFINWSAWHPLRWPLLQPASSCTRIRHFQAKVLSLISLLSQARGGLCHALPLASLQGTLTASCCADSLTRLGPHPQYPAAAAEGMPSNSSCRPLGTNSNCCSSCCCCGGSVMLLQACLCLSVGCCLEMSRISSDLQSA